MHTQPSQSNAGGVAIYIDEKLDHFKRDDLSKHDESFEAVWVEIKNIKGKTFLCGCVYRHPNTDDTCFTQYMETTFTEMNKDKYNIFIMGDFNIDLLQYDTHNSTNDFLNSMISHSFLPYVLQLTRVTDHSATIIDNIFSNVTDYDTSSGNITNLISDHFAQFLMIKKYHVSYKSCNYSVYDYSNFGKENFVHNYSQTEWSSLSDSSISVNEHFNHFYKKTTNCINLRVPKKKVSKKSVETQIQALDKCSTQTLVNYKDKLFHTMNKNLTPFKQIFIS